MPYLTDVERCVIDFIIYYNRKFRSEPPTTEIMEYHNLDLNAITPALINLDSYGYIKWRRGLNNGIKLTMHNAPKFPARVVNHETN